MKSREATLVDIAKSVLSGRPLNIIEIYGFAQTIEIDKFKPEFLPGAKTITGKPEERKVEIFRLAEAYWGIKPSDWLSLENIWLKSARMKSASQETTGKDRFDDVISAELLIRCVATIGYIDGLDKENNSDTKPVRQAAISSLNMVISEAIFKGQTRITRYKDKSVYAHLKAAGIMIGTGGGKYLPDPETSLPILFTYLNREKFSKDIYR